MAVLLWCHPLCGIACPKVYGLVREGYIFAVTSAGGCTFAVVCGGVAVKGVSTFTVEGTPVGINSGCLIQLLAFVVSPTAVTLMACLLCGWETRHLFV